MPSCGLFLALVFSLVFVLIGHEATAAERLVVLEYFTSTN